MLEVVLKEELEETSEANSIIRIIQFEFQTGLSARHQAVGLVYEVQTLRQNDRFSSET